MSPDWSVFCNCVIVLKVAWKSLHFSYCFSCLLVSRDFCGDVVELLAVGGLLTDKMAKIITPTSKTAMPLYCHYSSRKEINRILRETDTRALECLKAVYVEHASASPLRLASTFQHIRRLFIFGEKNIVKYRK